MTAKSKSWKAVATALYEAIAECDWSFGRAQEDRVSLNIHAAQGLYFERLNQKPKKKKTGHSSGGRKA